MRKIAGYWHQDRLDLYRFEKGRPVRISGGPLAAQKPARFPLQKTVLIVGRDHLFHTCRRYPPAEKTKLLNAARLELAEVCPFRQPASYIALSRMSSTSTELDIWAWESESLAAIRKVFPFSVVVPEDLLFSSSAATAFLWTQNGRTTLLAVDRERFLGAVSRVGVFPEEKVIGFLHGLEITGTGIESILSYGPFPLSRSEKHPWNICSKTSRDYPPCLDFLPQLDLRRFRAQGCALFSASPAFWLRVALYLIVGCGLLFYLTGREYQQATQSVQQAAGEIDRQILSLQNPGTDYAPVLAELQDKVASQPLPATVLEILAQTLPQGAYTEAVLLHDRKLEITVQAPDPVAVLEALARQEKVRDVRLKGPMRMAKKGAVHNFGVTMEIVL